MGRKILLDIDNTITTAQVVMDKMSDMFGKPYVTASDLKSYTIGEALGMTKEEDKLFWEIFGYEVLESSLPNQKVISKVFDDILKVGDELYIITARPYSHKFITDEWLSKYNIPYTELILVGDNSKVGFIERYDIEIVIDDNPKLFDELEVVKDLFPKSKVANRIKDGTMKRYIVDYPYNESSVGELTINRETGEVTERK